MRHPACRRRFTSVSSLTSDALLDDGLIEESDERPDADLDDQRRRYYRLTGLGRAVVAAEVGRLESLVDAARPWALESAG